MLARFFRIFCCKTSGILFSKQLSNKIYLIFYIYRCCWQATQGIFCLFIEFSWILYWIVYIFVQANKAFLKAVDWWLYYYSGCSSWTSSSTLKWSNGHRLSSNRIKYTSRFLLVSNSMVVKKVLKNIQHEGEKILALGKEQLEQNMAQQQVQTNTCSSR